MINFDTIRTEAQGRWPHILISLGLPSEALTNRHKPCPCCGGKDRFRFDDKGNGSFICNQCGAGDGFTLIQNFMGCDAKAAFKAVNDVIGGNDTKTPPRVIKYLESDSKPYQDDLNKLKAIWNESQPIQLGDHVATYLENRGLDLDEITPFSDQIRCHQGLKYWTQSTDNKPISLGVFPAMVGLISDIKGSVQGLHLTYLNNGHKLQLIHPETGEELTSKKMKNRYDGSLKGCAVQITASGRQLAVCEGIENALAARQLSGLPVWACLSANGLKKLVIPPEIEELFIYADNDAVGQQCAHSLAIRAIKSNIKVRLWTAEQSGLDVLDVLIRGDE